MLNSTKMKRKKLREIEEEDEEANISFVFLCFFFQTKLTRYKDG